LPDAYGVNHVGIAIPMSQAGGLDYISEFIEEEPALPTLPATAKTTPTQQGYTNVRGARAVIMKKAPNHNNGTNYRYKAKLCRHFEPLSPANAVTTSLIKPPTP
jgi:hypothetical protein